jgi:hypothetical protein
LQSKIARNKNQDKIKDRMQLLKKNLAIERSKIKKPEPDSIKSDKSAEPVTDVDMLAMKQRELAQWQIRVNIEKLEEELKRLASKVSNDVVPNDNSLKDDERWEDERGEDERGDDEHGDDEREGDERGGAEEPAKRVWIPRCQDDNHCKDLNCKLWHADSREPPK